MKRLRKILFILIGVLLSLSLLLATSVLILWMNPHWIINENNLRKMLSYTPQIKVTWTSLNIEFHNRGWLAKDMKLQSRDLCFIYPPQLDLCIPQLEISLFAGLQDWKPRLFQISQMRVIASHITYHPSPDSEPPPEGETSLLPTLRLPPFEGFIPHILDFTQLGEVVVRVDEFRLIAQDGAPLLAGLHIEKVSAEGQQLRLSIDFNAHKENVFVSAGHVDLHLTHRSLQVEGKAELQLKDFKITAPLHMTWAETLQARLRPEFRWQGEFFRPEISLLWSSQEIKLNAGPLVSHKLWSAASIRLSKLELISSLDQELGIPSRTRLATSLFLEPRKKIKDIRTIELDGDASLFTKVRRYRNSEELIIEGQAQVQGDHSLLQVEGSTQGDLTISRFDQPTLSAAQGLFQLKLNINRIEAWKHLLENTPLAIPAPLHVLQGTISATAEAKLPSLDSAVDGKAVLVTNLQSKTQALNTEVTALLSSQGPLRDLQVVTIDIDALLKKIELELPPLRLQAPPQFLPDKRFVLTEKDLESKEEMTRSKLPFALNWQAKVRTETPIQLRSNLLKQAIPVSLDFLVKKPSEMSGTVTVNAFPIELFKKKARIAHVDVVFHPGSRTPELDGLILYNNPEVDIRILLLGNTEKPRVEFESDPPLNRQQIISVLLFNKSLDELNEEEVDSATSLNHAMADGALGLFSLIFLSSTPIQSVSYDPTTGAYTARMRIDDRTTFSMGSDFGESRNFTLRRRLKGSWSIRSELKQQDNEPDVVLTLVEWLRRF